MMIYFTDSDIDRLIEDDLPAGDMTTFLLDLAGMNGSIALIARNPMIACCTEEAVRLYKKSGLMLSILFLQAPGCSLVRSLSRQRVMPLQFMSSGGLEVP